MPTPLKIMGGPGDPLQVEISGCHSMWQETKAPQRKSNY